MIAIFTTEHDAIAFNDAVCGQMGWPDAVTERYCVPQKHPSKNEWAVEVLPYAEPQLVSGTPVVEELTPDWYPPDRETL